MNALDATLPTTSTQTYLVERDAGLLCRILGLYAARGLDVLDLDYAHAAQGVMKLDVCVQSEPDGTAEAIRVLVDKAATWVGVLAACEQERGRSVSRPRPTAVAA